MTRFDRPSTGLSVLLAALILLVLPLQGQTSSGSGVFAIDDMVPGSGLVITPRRSLGGFRDSVQTLRQFVETVPVPFGSSDADPDDEFREALDALAALITELEVFKGRVEDMGKRLKEADVPLSEVLTGVNPVTYTWPDTRGEHAVTVEVGPFKLARLRQKKSSGFLKTKICMILTDYEDRDGSNTWVKVSRRDPSHEMGFTKWLGSRITKVARIGYDHDRVGVAAITLPAGASQGAPPCCSGSIVPVPIDTESGDSD